MLEKNHARRQSEEIALASLQDAAKDVQRLLGPRYNTGGVRFSIAHLAEKAAAELDRLERQLVEAEGLLEHAEAMAASFQRAAVERDEAWEKLDRVREVYLAYREADVGTVRWLEDIGRTVGRCGCCAHGEFVPNEYVGELCDGNRGCGHHRSAHTEPASREEAEGETGPRSLYGIVFPDHIEVDQLDKPGTTIVRLRCLPHTFGPVTSGWVNRGDTHLVKEFVEAHAAHGRAGGGRPDAGEAGRGC